MQRLQRSWAIAFAAVCCLAAGCPAPPAAAPSGPSGPAVPAAAAADPAAEPPAPTPIADAYRDTAARIVAAAAADRGAYAKLAYLTDHIGHRLSGSAALDRAVAWTAGAMRADGHENVRTEPVMVPHWVRGAESAELVAPVQRPLHILGLGGTIGTDRAGITGEVAVVTSFADLAARADQVRGKIVLYNTPMPAYDPERGSGYGDVVPYRVAGPSQAAKLGAIAVLMRSVTHHSLRSPHTGTLVYEPTLPKIPAAAVTTEDADLIARLVAGGDVVTVRLQLGARLLPDEQSANVIGELRGSASPDEIVLIGAHIDSWDVGQGAHDDGAGCAIVMQALTVLRQLGLRPRRTIRAVLFTNEENGLRGARAYAEAHAGERHVMALESDSGGFAPRGLSVQGSDTALAQVRDILSLLAPVGATEAQAGHGGADISPLAKTGVPALGLWVDGSRYFDYHHTHADTLDKVDPQELAHGVAVVAVTAYVIADMETPLDVGPPPAQDSSWPANPDKPAQPKDSTKSTKLPDSGSNRR